MKIIRADYLVSRDEVTGKKFYTSTKNPDYKVKAPNFHSASNEYMDASPNVSFEEADELIENFYSSGFHIRAMDDLVIVDTDSQEKYDEVQGIMDELDVKTFMITSDKGFGHYYFRTTDAFRDSPLVPKHKTGSINLDKLDIIRGQGWAFGWGENNPTKTHIYTELEEPKISSAIPMPPEILYYLESQQAVENSTSPISDGENYSSFHIGKQLVEALSELQVYKDNVNYDPRVAWDKFFIDLAPYFIPNKYKKVMNDDLYPDSLPQTINGTEFVQATVTKLYKDRSISHTVGMSLLMFMCGECWSDPYSSADILDRTANYKTQVMPISGLCYAYDEKLLAKPAISLNKGPMGPLYRTVNSEWIVETPQGVEKFNTLTNLNDTVMSMGCSSQGLPKVLTNKTKEKFIMEIETIKFIDDIRKDYGIQPTTEGLSEFNIYRRTIYHEILLGNEPEPEATKKDFPAIMLLLTNLTIDHAMYDEQEILIDKLLTFIKWKGTAMRYSALSFQLNGVEGTGKGIFGELMKSFFGKLFKLQLDKSNYQFNGGVENCLFGEQSEIPVTGELYERIKEKTGSETTPMELKGVDVRIVPNLLTPLLSTNSTNTFPDGRRVVNLSCFGAKPYPYKENQYKLQLELRRFAAYLRDLKYNPEWKDIYFTSAAWKGQLHTEAEKVKTETYGTNKAHQLGKLFERTASLTPGELHDSLDEVLGVGHFRYLVIRSQSLRIILHKANFTDHKGRANTHEITHMDLKREGYVEKPKVDANMRHLYSTSPTYRDIKLTTKQFEYFMKKENSEELDIPQSDPEM